MIGYIKNIEDESGIVIGQWPSGKVLSNHNTSLGKPCTVIGQVENYGPIIIAAYSHFCCLLSSLALPWLTSVVLYAPRRPLATRERSVLTMSTEVVDDKHFRLQLCTEAGTYPLVLCVMILIALTIGPLILINVK